MQLERIVQKLAEFSLIYYVASAEYLKYSHADCVFKYSSRHCNTFALTPLLSPLNVK